MNGYRVCLLFRLTRRGVVVAVCGEMCADGSGVVFRC